VAEVCRRLGISRDTYYRWKREGRLESRISGASDTRVGPYKVQPILGNATVRLEVPGEAGPQAPAADDGPIISEHVIDRDDGSRQRFQMHARGVVILTTFPLRAA
jgi:hypothetical protein